MAVDRITETLLHRIAVALEDLVKLTRVSLEVNKQQGNGDGSKIRCPLCRESIRR